MTSWLIVFVLPIRSQALCFVLFNFLFVQTPTSPDMLEMFLAPICASGIRIFFTVQAVSAFSLGPLLFVLCMEFPNAF